MSSKYHVTTLCNQTHSTEIVEYITMSEKAMTRTNEKNTSYKYCHQYCNTLLYCNTKKYCQIRNTGIVPNQYHDTTIVSKYHPSLVQT